MLRTILKPFSFLPALIMMYIIFSFSAQEGDISGQLSYQASVKIVETADYIFDADLDYYQIDHWAKKIDFITRKLAHMAEYFALAVAVSFPLYVYGMHGILLMLFAGLICVGFACGDEYHQSFVAGRGPSVKDVCIDSVGVFFGILFVRIIGWTGRNTIFRPKEKKKKNKKKRFGKKSDFTYDDYEDPYFDDCRRHEQDPYFDDRRRYEQDPYFDDRRRCEQDFYFDLHRDEREPNPPNPFWKPEPETIFNPNLQQPKREYWENDDPYADDWGFDDKDTHDNDWGFDDNVSHDNDWGFDDNVSHDNDWGFDDNVSHGNDWDLPKSPPKRKKKPEKDWFFDL